MISCRSALRACFVLLTLSLPVVIQAQTNCDEGAGPLSTAQPKGMTVQEVIEKFAAREAVFKEARDQYTYTQDISVQELDGNTVTGEFRLVNSAWCRMWFMTIRAIALRALNSRRNPRYARSG